MVIEWLNNSYNNKNVGGGSVLRSGSPRGHTSTDEASKEKEETFPVSLKTYLFFF